MWGSSREGGMGLWSREMGTGWLSREVGTRWWSRDCRAILGHLQWALGVWRERVGSSSVSR